MLRPVTQEETAPDASATACYTGWDDRSLTTRSNDPASLVNFYSSANCLRSPIILTNERRVLKFVHHFIKTNNIITGAAVIITVPGVCGCETWSVTLREEHGVY